MKRWKIREEIFKILYQLDINQENPEAVLDHFAEEHPEDLEVLKFIKDIVRNIAQHKEEIDNIIISYAKNWSIERMATTIRNILRLAVAEMLYQESVPYEVSIAEAVKLAKRYGDPKWEQFVNGILGKFLEDQRILGLPKNKL